MSSVQFTAIEPLHWSELVTSLNKVLVHMYAFQKLSESYLKSAGNEPCFGGGQ